MEKVIAIKFNDNLDKLDNDELTTIFNKISELKDKKIVVDEKTISLLIFNGVMDKMYKYNDRWICNDNIAAFIITKMFFKTDAGLIWLDEIYHKYFDFVSKIPAHTAKEFEEEAANWSREWNFKDESTFKKIISTPTKYTTMFSQWFGFDVSEEDVTYIIKNLDKFEYENNNKKIILSKVAHLWALQELLKTSAKKAEKEKYKEEDVW